jgi:8-oxo-dGTP pyrophosphatase MutT (NUDIX family)
VAGVILYQDGRVLLQHRDDRPDIVYPGAWAIFGGHVEPDEDPEAAARREIEEELGLRLEGPLEPVVQQDRPDRQRTVFATPLTVPVEQLTLNEGQGMALLSRADLAEYQVVPAHREILERFLDGRAA